MTQSLDLFPEPERLPRQRERLNARSPEAQAILAELRKKPMAVDHMADHLGYPIQDTRLAFRALIDAGEIVDVQERIKTPTYTHSIVWHPARP